MVFRDIVLIVSVLGVTVLGYFIMKRLDRFLDKNRENIEKEEKEPSCVMLTADMTDEELLGQIRTYEKKHGNAHITLYHDEDD